MNEEIQKYLKNYKVYPDGRVYSYHTNKFLKQSKNNSGYLYVNLWDNGSVKSFKVHRLVAITYIDNPENKSDVNHKNGDKQDNRVCNLEWNTRKENMNHSFHVLKRQTKTKLTKDQVIEIRKLAEEGYTQREIARKFDVCASGVCNIINRKTWQYI